MTPSSLGKVNSETNLAVQLLLAVSDGARATTRCSTSADISDAKMGSVPSTSSDLNHDSNDSRSDEKSDWSDSPSPRGALSCEGQVAVCSPRRAAMTAGTYGGGGGARELTNWTGVTVRTESTVPTVNASRTVGKMNVVGGAGCAFSAPGRTLSTPMFKYSRQERQEALQRFREKKQRRQFQKRVRYHVRKRLAEARPRYKGRFSKPGADESSDDGSTPQRAGNGATCASGGDERTLQKATGRSKVTRSDAAGSNDVSRKAVAVAN